MLMIRLARIGKKSKPFYRLVISEKRKDLYGDSLEILGAYNPHTKELKANSEKVKYWLSKGAGMSPTVNNLLIEKRIVAGKKVKASHNKKSNLKATKPASKPTDIPTPTTKAPKPETIKTEAPVK